MNKLCFLLILSLSFSNFISAQDTLNGRDYLEKYRRSSLYTVLIKHSSFPYGEQIDSAFMQIPIPEKFNDHNLHIRSFESSAKKQRKSGKKKVEANSNDVTDFIMENDIPRRIVSKWFNRCDSLGVFNMELIQDRGSYDASQQDINIADKTILGRAILADAGEDLIGKTFMLVNDITYTDKGATSAKIGGVIRLLGQIAAAATEDERYNSIGTATGALVSEIDGFSVGVTSYLFRLNWNDEISATFYDSYWVDTTYFNKNRVIAFDTCSMFSLSYIGKTSISAGNISSKSFSKSSKMKQMSKVCARAIDKSIVELQREYEEFKVNTPIATVNEDGTIDAYIGIKEGLNLKSVYEILMPEEVNGDIKYSKIGRAKPIEGKIWDNRYGALDDADLFRQEGESPKDEEAEGADPYLKATSFSVDGNIKKIFPGCLLREVTIKVVK